MSEAPTVVDRDVKPENVAPIANAQPSPYGSMGTRGDDPLSSHHAVELAGLASALATVAERLAEVARALREEPGAPGQQYPHNLRTFVAQFAGREKNGKSAGDATPSPTAGPR